MGSILLEDGATSWAEKLATQWRDIPLFLDMFPDGRVIHIFRDPRNVTASYKRMTYEPWPAFLDAGLNCKATMIELPQMEARYGAERLLILRAEDLARDLAGEIARICDFLSEPLPRAATHSRSSASPPRMPNCAAKVSLRSLSQRCSTPRRMLNGWHWPENLPLRQPIPTSPPSRPAPISPWACATWRVIWAARRR